MISSPVLTDEAILNIIKDPSLYNAFPALNTINKKLYYADKEVKSGCSKCQRNRIAKANSSKTNAVKAFKEYIKHMDNDTRNKFKDSIHCSDLRFTAPGNDGRMKEYRY